MEYLSEDARPYYFILRRESHRIILELGPEAETLLRGEIGRGNIDMTDKLSAEYRMDPHRAVLTMMSIFNRLKFMEKEVD